MTNELEIRKAILADIEVLLDFEQGIISAERSFDATLKEGPIRYYDLTEMLADPQVEVVVAEYDKKIIASGYARIVNAQPFLRHQQYAYVGFMYVHPKYRGRGINTAIVEKLKHIMKSRGMIEMRLEVYYQNEVAIKAYEKAGFQKHMIEMRMPI